MVYTCRGASTDNLTLSGEQTVDGTALVSGDQVLVKDQTTASQNGVYRVSVVAWTNQGALGGDLTTVELGTVNDSTFWFFSTATSIRRITMTLRPETGNHYETVVFHCRAVTLANITLSGAQTVDGVALVAGDVCLVRSQTTASENDLYVVTSGAWVRLANATHDRVTTHSGGTVFPQGRIFLITAVQPTFTVQYIGTASRTI